MKQLFIFFLGCCALAASSQTIEQCRQRYNSYLNFRGKLSNDVRFETDAIYLLNGKGQKQLAVYANEIAVLAAFFENSDLKAQEQLIKQKGLQHYDQRRLDSLSGVTGNVKAVSKTASPLPLKGFRIALDPGHFGTTLTEAKVEQKFLYFVRDSLKAPKDTVKLFESSLTFNTALLLKNMLEEQGAEVLLTRTESNYTSFNCTYAYWLKTHKRRTLDSLKACGQMPPAKYNKLLKCTEYAFFWDFFRDYDLVNRANKINAFHPHTTAVIHYNVDEKNAPWKKTTPKDYCMAFIGGAFTSIEKTESRINFLRLLLTDQLDRSEQLSATAVAGFHKNLGIAVARRSDASYLEDNCLEAKSPGVYCRNLLLCRKINSVLVYGEGLYQDNEKEVVELMRRDVDLYGIATNARLLGAAKSYYEALLSFLKND